MKPLLKPHKNVDWHTSVADDTKTTDFLDKLSAFFTDNNISRNYKDLRKKRRAQTLVNQQQQVTGQEEALPPNSINGKHSKPGAGRPVEIADEQEEKVTVTKKDWPVELGLRSMMRALDGSEQLAMAIVDARVLSSAAFSLYFGVFAASCPQPIYAVHGLNNRLAKQVNFSNLHAIGVLKQKRCESIVASAAELLIPVSVTVAVDDGLPSDRKRRFTPANVVTPVAASNKKRKRRKKNKQE